MEQATDVERLFSWLKTEDLRYREFAGAREVTDAVATWPALHRAAAQTGHAGEAPSPTGDMAAKERIARDRMTLPPAAAEAIRAGAPMTVPPPPLAGGRLMSALGRRMHGGRQGMMGGPDETASAVPGRGGPAGAGIGAEEQDAAAGERAREAAERLRERLDAAMAVNPRPAPTAERHAAPREGRTPLRSAPAAAPRGGRGGLFGGVYSGRPAAADYQPEPEPPRSGQSLRAVFSRLSASRSRALPDPRERARSSPGLGSVFNRLR